MKATFISLTLLSILSPVLSHGIVNKITVTAPNGSKKTYKGNQFNQGLKQQFDSPIRQVKTNSPITNLNSADMACGIGAAKNGAKLTAEVQAGSKIDFQWTSGSGNWPHNTGPMLTYLASCGSTSCDKVDATKAKWFKIDQVGQKKNSATWVQADLLNKNAPASATLPATLAPGNYLLRHEIIGLHLASTSGKAEFYPSCAQIKVTGSGKASPQNSELLSFPGAYKKEDKGIHVNVFSGQISQGKVGAYPFPGGKVSSLSATGSSTPSTDDKPVANPGSSNSSTPKPSPSSSCGSKKSKRAHNASLRRRSRIMRDILAYLEEADS